MSNFPRLFSSTNIGPCTLDNRIVMLPMGARMSNKGVSTAEEAAFYEARAKGGAGLIVVGMSHIHRSSSARGRVNSEGFDSSDLARESRKRLVETQQRHGAKVFAQIGHTGREAPNKEFAPVAPSPIRSPASLFSPKVLSEPEIRMLVQAYASTAHYAQQNGYNGVEIQAHHGYLLGQFLSLATNVRNDRYGGTQIQGRARFLLEALTAVRDNCGSSFPIGVRLSISDELPSGLRLEDTLQIVGEIEASGSADYISLTWGSRGNYVKDGEWPEGFTAEPARRVKDSCGLPIILGSRIRTPEMAEEILQRGDADLVGIGRGFIADPEWARKARHGEQRQIRPCIGIVQDCRLSEGGVTCAVNARAGRELELPELSNVRLGSGRRERVVVVGGGPAGLEAARLAASIGFDITLLEERDKLGGQLNLAAKGPTRGEVADFVYYLDNEVRRLGVEVHLETRITTLSGMDAEFIVIATGARPNLPPFKVAAGSLVLSSHDLLGGPMPAARTAVVVDDGTGFWDSISAAELLAGAGVTVHLATPSRAVGLAIPHESVMGMTRRLRTSGVEFYPFTHVTSVELGRVCLADVITSRQFELDVDLVVYRADPLANDELIGLPTNAHVVAIGDCLSPRRIGNAVHEANVAVRERLLNRSFGVDAALL